MKMNAYLEDIDLRKRILEIGPLTSPLLEKSEANVYYADRLSTQGVKERYKDMPEVDKNAILDIDFVIQGGYTETFKDTEKFDYIISHHVIEHVPRFIEFFIDTVNILNKNGKMYILAPDCRYCFDHFRGPTSFAEMYYIHTQGIVCAPWQVLDSKCTSVPLNDAHVFWENKKVFSVLTRRKPFAEAKKFFEQVLQGEYVGAHFSTFTPLSFLLLLHDMTRVGLFPYKLHEFFPTFKNTFTFGLVLEACPELPGDAKLSEQAMAAIRRTMMQVADFEETQK